MERGSVFMTKRTQAIRLPKSMRLPDGVTSVDIVRRGRTWIIVPSNESWAEWWSSLDVSAHSVFGLSASCFLTPVDGSAGRCGV
jgi:antitoxin VapB